MSFQTEIYRTRERIINRTLFTTVIFVLFALIPSLLRISAIGWQPAMILHIAASFTVLVTFVLKNQFSLKIKSIILYIICLFVSIAGLLNFRIAGGAQYIFPIITISVLIYGLSTGLTYAIIFMVLFIVTSILHTKHIIKINLDFNVYTNNPKSWLALITGFGFSLIVIIDSTSLYYRFFINYIKESYSKSVELAEVNKKLMKTEKRYRSIFEGSKDGIIMVDKNLKITDCNKSYLNLVGYELTELIGKDYRHGLPESDFDWTKYFMKLTKETGSNKTAEVKTRHKNGEFIPIEVIPNMIESDNEVFVWGVIRDIRDRKKVENQIYSTMITAEEKERERYAKELHDGLGPLLSTGLIYINAIKDEEDKALKNEYIQRAYEIINEATTLVQEISNNLSPVILSEYGVTQAIRSFIEKAQPATDIDFSIVDKIVKRFSETIEITLYRTIVELINNSIKYSRAKKVVISFRQEQKSYLIRYQDNGVGFDYQKAIDVKSGFGLLNLESRIKKLGAKYIFKTSPGNGVIVTIQLNEEFI